MMRWKLPGIRWQLAVWYAASSIAVVLLVAGIFALSFKVILDVQVDHLLSTQARQIANSIHIQNGQWTFVPQVDTISSYARIIDEQGQIRYSTPSLQGLLLTPASIQDPLAGGTWHDTVRVQTIHLVRLYASPIREHGTIVGVIQVGQSLDLVTATAGLSALVLAVLLPIVLFLSLLGGYWIAGCALSPVRRLVHLAGAIHYDGDLHQRVPVPLAHDEIRALAETFNTMLSRLDEAFALQRRFIADASHDLRTPVAAILSIAENARDGIGSLTHTQSLAAIAEQAQRLRKLITNLLQLSRADDSRLDHDWEDLHIAFLLHEVAASMQLLAKERGIEMTLGLLEDGIIRGDLTQVLLVIMNLVDNALTYTPNGGRIHLSCRRDAAWMIIVVQDTGTGIAAEDLSHIFERFYRADRARQYTPGGNGLGLSIVQALVASHGGRITVESTPGVGSCFEVWLPCLT